jgi:hypothetical protein
VITNEKWLHNSTCLIQKLSLKRIQKEDRKDYKELETVQRKSKNVT